jgi:hypothetical protein
MAIMQVSGKIKALRVHDLGTGYGPNTDFIDVEAVVALEANDNRYGFQLRQDPKLPAREGMLELLLTAMRNNWNITIDYDAQSGKKNHIMFRVWVTK